MSSSDSDSDSASTRVLKKERKKREKRQKKDGEKIAKVMLNIYKNTMYRYKNIKDPSTKYTLLVDKLCLALDISMAALTVLTDEYKINSELCAQITDASSDLQKELGNLIDWVQSPNYSPDKAYGNQIMKDAEEAYKDKTINL